MRVEFRVGDIRYFELRKEEIELLCYYGVKSETIIRRNTVGIL